ncbi:MAG: hypothetical protein ABJN42_00600 [Roseibium sp.]|uniref:hypothetical protein n=1 Tax=Roseibium sp. TaxID=1936156 RepID=UPI0032991602
MSQFGFYDPASLRPVADGVLAIDFLDAQDANKVSTIEMKTKDDVQRVIDRLDDQQTHKMSSLGDDGLQKMAGVIRFNQQEPGFGMMVSNEKNQRVPVRLAFGAEIDELPENGICMVMGAMNDGAFDVYKMAVRPVAPEQVIGLELGQDEEEPYP